MIGLVDTDDNSGIVYVEGIIAIIIIITMIYRMWNRVSMMCTNWMEASIGISKSSLRMVASGSVRTTPSISASTMGPAMR